MGKNVVLVSGGSRGLGKGMVVDLRAHGYRVATFSRSESDFIAERRAADPAQESFFWQPLDATDPKALKSFVKQIYQKYGRIDGLVNNAGANLDQLLPMTTDAQISRMLGLNLESVMQLTRNVSRIMLKQGSGSIVNMSSILGHRGYKGTSVYSATKAALDGFSRGLARELGSRGIRVNSISPGFIATHMTHNMPEGQKAQVIRRTPLGRLGQVDDIVGLVRFLLSSEAKFITGQAIVVDGGLTC